MNTNKDSLLKKTLKILKRKKLRLSKKLGQSFIIDPYYIQKQLEYAELTQNDVILEIGCGIGNLTRYIAPLVKKVICIEVDRRFKEILRVLTDKFNNIDVIFDDVLKADFPAFNKILSNIPYYISSPITFKLLKYSFELGVLTYQYEFAKRLIAKTGEPDYGRVTVNFNLYAEAKLMDVVPKDAFFPIPAVDSAIVKITPRRIKIASEIENFELVIRELFAYKNRKVRKATGFFLKKLGKDRHLIEKVLSELPYADLKVKELDIKMVDDVTLSIFRNL
ncbi:MAG: 16S rRNA (adenine(1518)-N(6)/adenine(1519)-N(6))-dimethyltransferase RsmA [Candidatus Odinarchaeia archaeon]